MRAELRKRILLVISALFLLTFLTGIAIAQTVPEEKKTLSQTSTQSQFSYKKMVQSEECTQQMIQNQYTYEKKVQNKTATSKMTKSGTGNSGSQGQQDSRSDSDGSANGEGNS